MGVREDIGKVHTRKIGWRRYSRLRKTAYISLGEKFPELYWRLSANLYLQSDSTGAVGGEWVFGPGEGLKDLSTRACVSIYRPGR